VNQSPETPGHIDDKSVSWKFASHLDAHESFLSPTYKFSSEYQTAIEQRWQAVQFNWLSSQRPARIPNNKNAMSQSKERTRAIRIILKK
jgi:hypothetical protein